MKPSNIALVLGVALVAQCHPQSRTQPARSSAPDPRAIPAPRPKCEGLCRRTFGDCMKQVLVATGKIDRTRIRAFERNGVLRQAGAIGYATCVRGCRLRKRRDRERINICLRRQTCESYAACLAPAGAARLVLPDWAVAGL